jgi:hypothetical protein
MKIITAKEANSLSISSPENEKHIEGVMNEILEATSIGKFEIDMPILNPFAVNFLTYSGYNVKAMYKKGEIADKFVGHKISWVDIND